MMRRGVVYGINVRTYWHCALASDGMRALAVAHIDGSPEARV